MTNTEDITLPIAVLLDQIIHHSYNDCGSVNAQLGDLLADHPRNGIDYVLEVELFTERYMVWRPEAWKLYLAHERSWPSYFAATRHKQKQLEFAALTPKQQLRFKIEEQKKAGNMTAVAMMEWAYSMMKGK